MPEWVNSIYINDRGICKRKGDKPPAIVEPGQIKTDQVFYYQKNFGKVKEKEANMKMVIAVMVTRFIISLFEKDKTTKQVTKKNISGNVQDPAAFWLR